MTKDIFINQGTWQHFTEEEMDAYINSVFLYFRTTGFPFFPTDHITREKEYSKLVKYNFQQCINYEEQIIKQTMHGLSLAWSYMPHSWKVVCNDKLTPWDVFHDDDLLLKCIRKRTKMGGNMSNNGLRKMMKLFTGTQSVSNFRPTAAAAIYYLFAGTGDTVWDMSMGFGGRLLGAHLAKVKYIGTDPSTPTFNGLCQMNEDFGIGGELHQMGSEDFIPEPESLDFCFTSPPYFDTEKYTDEDTQSYKRFPDTKVWLDGFLKTTFDNCYTGLKPDKYMAVNVANTKRFPNFEEKTILKAIQAGFSFETTWKLALSNPTMNSTKSAFKYEPIFIFRK
jgi:hypothetical protein